MPNTDTALIAHLMRRAGFGANHFELQKLAEKSYEDIVEDLVNPERFEEPEEDLLRRFYPMLGPDFQAARDGLGDWSGRWIYHMLNSPRALQEKMSLLWHQVFATAWHKSEHVPTMLTQIDMFRKNGLGNMRDILLDLSKDPAMINWLDNNENHKSQINENYGRELLELFSMGVGNYTEDDIKSAARAFTGWTFIQPLPLYPYGHFEATFKYDPDDHDAGEKHFLGHTGNFNGEEIIDIIVSQPAAARFIARHLYNFFVADEVQVPAWNETPPKDPQAIEILVDAYFEHDGDLRSIMRVLLNSDFFKNSRFKRVKNPVELVVSTIKLVGTHRQPEQGLKSLVAAAADMGQHIMNPPTVEGWHTGHEWIDGGTLNERINFSVNEIDVSKPGVKEIIEQIESAGSLSPSEFVETMLQLSGQIELNQSTKDALTMTAESEGALDFSSNEKYEESAEKIKKMLQLIVSSREYQFA